MAHKAAFLGALVLCLSGCAREVEPEAKTKESIPVVQTKKAALQQMCSIPKDIADDPKDIGPYLAKRITNPEVIKLLQTLDDPMMLKPLLKEHGINPERCDLLTALE